MGKLILAAFADECSRDVREQVRVLHKTGISHLEPRFIGEKNIADLSAKEAKTLKETLEDIQVYSIGSPLGKINLADDFEAHLEKARRVFDTARILGAKNVRVFSFYLHEGKSRSECREEVLEKLGRLVDLAADYGVTLCHENEAKIYGESPEQCLDLLTSFGGRLKCVFDMGNFVLGGYHPWPEGYGLLKEYIQYFHIKDARYDGAIVPPGCGQAFIGEILKQHLAERKADTVITLEPHLLTFEGLQDIAAAEFSNPYVYETKEEAFLDAADRLQKIAAFAEGEKG